MTREQAKDLLPIIQAFAEGKHIQWRNHCKKWIDVDERDGLYTEFPSSIYRIKPEPTYRPFRTKEECWNEMLKHQPFGWVKYGESIYSIQHIDSDSITISDYEGLYSHEFNVSFVNSTFIDGTPFGVKE